jgi:SAM-dependent methyltransferase
MDEARSAGWEVAGVDVSAEMAAFAREELGLDAVAGRFRDVALPEASFDCVTMWDYLEHSTDPTEDLAYAWRLLRPGGVVALSTGDVGSLVARASGRRWHLLTPRHHNFFFGRRTLHQLMRKADFEPEELRARAARYPARYLVHKLRTTGRAGAFLSSLFERVATGRLGSIAVPVNLFDIVTAVARKPREGGRGGD